MTPRVKDLLFVFAWVTAWGLVGCTTAPKFHVGDQVICYGEEDIIRGRVEHTDDRNLFVKSLQGEDWYMYVLDQHLCRTVFRGLEKP